MKKLLLILFVCFPGILAAQNFTAEEYQTWNIEEGINRDNGLNVINARLVSLNEHESKTVPNKIDMAMLFVAEKRGSVLVSFFTTKLRLDLTRTN